MLISRSYNNNNDWPYGETLRFVSPQGVSPRPSMFPEAKPRVTLRVEGKENSLFPVGPVIKVFCYTSQLKKKSKVSRCVHEFCSPKVRSQIGLTHGTWHERSCLIGKRIWVGKYNKIIYLVRINLLLLKLNNTYFAGKELDCRFVSCRNLDENNIKGGFYLPKSAVKV